MLTHLMDIENSRAYVDDIYSDDPERCIGALERLKNQVIGSNRQKGAAIEQGLVPRLLKIIEDKNQPIAVRNEAVIVLGSLAKGTEDHVRELCKADVVPVLLQCVERPEDVLLAENCLRCTSSIFKHSFAPIDVLFDRSLIKRMVNLMLPSISNQISVTSMLSVSVKTPAQQTMLWDEGAVFSLAALLCSDYYPVLMPSLTLIACLCHNNNAISSSICTASFGGKSMQDLIVDLMARDKPIEMQLAAAKCITFIYRSEALNADNPRVVFKTLPVLVYLCQSKFPWKIRVEAAETLAYLIEVSVQLQRQAAISNHLIQILNTFINPTVDSKGKTDIVSEDARKELIQSAFRVFASLGANDEDIRKKIIESDNLAEHIVKGLDDSNFKVKVASVRCLHSLSRSVQQLRTTFQDHNVWKPLMRLLDNASEDLLTIASSTLCNLLLEFSPAKEPIVECGAVDLLCKLIKKDTAPLRLNGIWALMNMAFQADQKIKSQILNTLGMNQIISLLEDSAINIVMKTLGLLRNLLSTKPHIDYIMSLHGKDIIRGVSMIFKQNRPVEVREQALCVLANISDGDSSKEFIMDNDYLLNTLKTIMSEGDNKLKIASVFCISNLVWKSGCGVGVRQERLRNFGFIEVLKELVTTEDTVLFDKVKTAMTQFSET